ncbi:MAG: hypothetical protein AB1610_01865 [Nitrospirota bacterium]
MKITKSSRHSKITGNFAESLILYWLSKYGFECAKVEHTGIDIIARKPNLNTVMGREWPQNIWKPINKILK